MSTIAAGTTSTTGLVQTSDTTGNLVLQVNGTTPSLTLNTAGAHGVGSSPSYGTSGQFLTSQGSAAAPTWTSAPASALTKISTQTASSSAALQWTGLTADKYLIVFENLIPANNNSNLYMQLGTGVTPTWITSGNYYFGTFTGYNGGIIAPNGTSNRNGSYLLLEGYYQIGTSGYVSGTVNLQGLNSSSLQSYTATTNAFDLSSPWQGTLNVSGTVNQTTQVTAIQIYFNAGNITSGSATLYSIS